MTPYTINIVGAGIVGACTAYYLAKNGHRVRIFDREPLAAGQCSKANGGQISVCNAETWNTWSNVWKGMKWMTQADAPLLMRPSLEFDKMKWIAGFLKETVRGTHRRNTLKTIMLGKRSSALYEELVHEEGIKFDQAKSGMLHVYTSEKSFEEAKYSADFFNENGVTWHSMSPDEIVEMDPMMADFQNLVGGFHTPTDWVGDAHKFSNELLAVCEAKYGVEVYYGIEVDALTGEQGNIVDVYETVFAADKVIICNGHEIREIAKELGDDLNVYPVKGYSITIENAVGLDNGAPLVSLLDDDRKIVTSTLGNRLRVAGTAELDGTNLDIRPERIKPLLDWVKINFPTVDLSEVTEWACLRPMNANMMPIVRQSTDNPDAYYHGAHGHLGWTLAAATSQNLVNLIENY